MDIQCEFCPETDPEKLWQCPRTGAVLCFSCRGEVYDVLDMPDPIHMDEDVIEARYGC